MECGFPRARHHDGHGCYAAPQKYEFGEEAIRLGEGHRIVGFLIPAADRRLTYFWRFSLWRVPARRVWLGLPNLVSVSSRIRGYRRLSREGDHVSAARSAAGDVRFVADCAWRVAGMGWDSGSAACWAEPGHSVVGTCHGRLRDSVGLRAGQRHSRTMQCSGRAIKSVGVVRVWSRAADRHR